MAPKSVWRLPKGGENTMRSATLEQYLEIGQMIGRGAISKELAQAIIEDRVVIRGDIGSFFVALVVYVQPEFEELKRMFPAFVHPKYKNNRFDPIERCKNVPTFIDSHPAFEYVHLNRHASTDEVLAEMDSRRLRPALYEELLGFAERYPDEQWKYRIVALGSTACVSGDRAVAYLSNDGDGCHGNGRGLDLGWVVCGWNEGFRFLAVRK